MFSFAGTAQEAGAYGRSGAAGILVRGSLMGHFSLCAWLTSLFFRSTVALWLTLWWVLLSENMNIGSNNTFSNFRNVFYTSCICS